MKPNKLLAKQLEKYLPQEFRDKEALQSFIQAVNDAYNSYEHDIQLSEKDRKKCEKEYIEHNHRLQDEIEQKKSSIRQLKDAIGDIGAGSFTDSANEDDLLGIAAYLKQQIARQGEIEKKLQYQEQFYEQILNFIPADIAVVDKQHRYLFVNPHAIKDPELRMWIIGKTDEDYRAYRNQPASASAERMMHFEKAVRLKKKITWEETIKGKNGVTEHHFRILFPVFDDDGVLDIMIIYGVNITDRKKTEEKIKINETRYRSIFDNSQALICTHDLKGEILDANKTAEVTFGYTRNELIGIRVSNLLPPDRQTEFEAVYMNDIKTKGKSDGIMVAIGKEGRRIYLLYHNYLVTNESEAPYVIGFSQDITGRINAEKALKKSEEKYRGIIENMNLGLLQVDPTEKIIYANQSFCEMSGYEIEELIGKEAFSLFIKGEKYNYSDTVPEKRKDNRPDVYEIQVRNKQGDIKWWLISSAPVIDNNGAFAGSIGIHLDITIQKNLEQELRSAKGDAEHSAHVKELFLANMSHEIRTPMNAIIGIGRLMAKTSIDQQQKFYLDIIQNASNNLLVIINDLLDFSKIEAGKVSLEYIGFSLHDILQNAVYTLEHKAEEKGLILTCHVASEIAPVLIGDPYRINQVLMNLLSNSLKFTETGAVKVSCEMAKEDVGSQQILFTVSDTGIGISEEFLNHLFDKFTQEDESVTRKFGGTGLGMSISKQLIELMGGAIHVESSRNTGTTISFTIAFPTGTKDDLPNALNNQVDTQILKGKRVLLVEDNLMNRILACTILTQYGADVVEAADGSIAIEKFSHDIFDMILMDIQMPVKNGIETTLYIREHLDKTIPIIALTANAFKREEERCLAAGMNDFIAKPFDEDKMVQLIAQWLGREANMSMHTSPPKPKENVKLFDLAKISALSRGDENFIKKITGLFITDAANSVQQMENACQAGDWETLAGIAHRIRPSLINFGITSLTADLETIEVFDPSSADATILVKNVNHIKKVMDVAIPQLKEELESMGPAA